MSCVDWWDKTILQWDECCCFIVVFCSYFSWRRYLAISDCLDELLSATKSVGMFDAP